MTSAGQRSSFKPSRAVSSERAISKDDSTADLRYRLQRVGREAESVDPGGNNKKLAVYQAWLATSLACNARQTYVPLFWYLFLDLPQQLVRNLSRVWLRAHTSEVESAFSLAKKRKEKAT
eukprot:179199-Pelagomonas_calceolata.AAC.1